MICDIYLSIYLGLPVYIFLPLTPTRTYRSQHPLGLPLDAATFGSPSLSRRSISDRSASTTAAGAVSTEYWLSGAG